MRLLTQPSLQFADQNAKFAGQRQGACGVGIALLLVHACILADRKVNYKGCLLNVMTEEG
jgi:hypothetical protein